MLPLLGAALVLKSLVLARLHDHPLLGPTGGLDSEVYVDLAARVASGDLLLRPEPFFVAPLYVYFLAPIFAVSRGSLLAVKVVQVLLGTLAVGLVSLSGFRLFGRRAGLIAGLLYALAGVVTFHEVLILQAALDPFLTALALFLLARALFPTGVPAARPFAAAGLAFGLLVLNRPNALLCAAAAAVLVAVSRGLKEGAILAAAVALVIAPVTLRNLAVAGEPVLVSSHGGLNLYIGNNAEADGTYRSVPGITPSIAGQAADARRVAERAVGRALSASEVSRSFAAQAWAWIRSHPASAGRLFLSKLGFLVNELEIPLNYSYRYYSMDSGSPLALLFVGAGILVPLGFLGLFWRLHDAPRSAYASWAIFVPAYVFSVAAFFVSSRYRLPLLVPLAIGAGGAVDRLVEAARAKRGRVVGGALAAALPLFWLALRPLGLDDGRVAEETEMVLHLVDVGAPDARARLTRLLERHPQRGLLLFRVAQALEARGALAEAATTYERALSADPGRAEIAVRLAALLAGAGDETGARAALRSISSSAEPPTALAVGAAALSLRELGVAERMLSSVIVAEPSIAEAHEKLGLVRALQGRSADAENELREACRRDPTSASAALNLAAVFAGEGRRDEARRFVRKALQLRPGYPQAQALLSELEK